MYRRFQPSRLGLPPHRELFFLCAHDFPEIVIEVHCVSAIVRSSMAVCTDCGNKLRVIRTAIGQASNVMRFEIRLSCRCHEGGILTAALAYSASTPQNILPHDCAAFTPELEPFRRANFLSGCD